MTTLLETKRRMVKNGNQKESSTQWHTIPKGARWDQWVSIGLELYQFQGERLRNLTDNEIDSEIMTRMPEEFQKRRSGPVSYKQILKRAVMMLKETVKLAEEDQRLAKANAKPTIEVSLQQRLGEHLLDVPSAGATGTAVEPTSIQPHVRVMPEPPKVRTVNVMLPPLQLLESIIPQLAVQELVGVQHLVTARLVEMIGHAKLKAETTAHQ